MFRDEYTSEVDYLQQLADELARKHPRAAPLLGRDASPAASRIFQSASFLFARLRQRLDDDAPEIIHPVIESLFPALLQPTPSSTIMELRPLGTMKEAVVVQAGSPFASADGAAPCVFRSTVDTLVVPWNLVRVDVSQERRELRLELAVLEGAKLATLPAEASLRLFFGGSPAAGLDLRSALVRGTREVVARDPRGGAHVVRLVDKGAPLRPVRGLPIEGREISSLASLRGYFAAPAHFAFLDIPNIDRVVPLAAATGRVEIGLELAVALPRTVRPSLETVRLHCVPAVNVHALVEPLHALVRSRRCTLALPRPGMQVHSVDRVSVVGRDLQARAATPFAQFFPPAFDADGQEPLFFTIERRPSVVGAEPLVSLVFDGPRLDDVRAADVHVHAIDGSRAERLRIGDVRRPQQGSPSLVTFENISPVTRALPPTLEGDRMWRWLQILKGSLPQLATREQLAACLALANQPAWAQWPEAKPNAAQLEAITDVRVLTRAKRADDAAIRIAIDIDAEAFGSLGEVDVFGELAADLLASTLRRHECVELTVCDPARAPLFSYAPVHGTREGL